MTEKGKAAWFLALLSPLTAEVLSGSSPPLEFFAGMGFLFLIPMYGGGALLVRELSLRWDKGWATVLLLGAAYGIVEEGIAVKSFFDPNWVDLGDLGAYGRFLEVNWVWTVWLTIFHTVVSITVPILILELWYPRTKRQPLLTQRQFTLVGLLYVADIAVCAVMFVSLQEYVPPPVQYAACFAAVYLLCVAARRAPKDLVSARHRSPSWSPWRFLTAGFAFMLLSMVFGMGAPESLPPAVTITVLLLICGATLLLLQHRVGAVGNSAHKAYFAAGLLLILIIVAPFHELAGMMGMSAVAVAFAVFLILLMRRARAADLAARAHES
ncbi:MAG: hypothetical protein AB1793_05455 [Candidatus Thermoplasmatota archaeon]